MRLGSLFAGLLPLLGLAAAQASEPWCDPANGICYQRGPLSGMTFGSVYPTDFSRNEFIGTMIVPTTYAWAGYSIGGRMRKSLLVVVFPNKGDFKVSTRVALTYTMPTWFTGPNITKLPSSTINSTHWKFVFRCQNCLKWTFPDGSTAAVNNTYQIQAFAGSTRAGSVKDPTNANSTFEGHTNTNVWGQDVTAARSSKYDTYLAAH